MFTYRAGQRMILERVLLRRPGRFGLFSRSLSTKRPAKKQSAYTFQNVQASFSYLFNQGPPPPGAPLKQPKTHESTGAGSIGGKENSKSARQISFKYLFDPSKPIPKENIQGPTAQNVDPRAQDQQASAPVQKNGAGNTTNNQIATLRYLFAAKAVTQDPQTQPRRGRKRGEQVSKGMMRISNDDLKHKNLVISLRYLFGQEHVPL